MALSQNTTNDFSSLKTGASEQPKYEPVLVHQDNKFVCPVHGGLLRQPIQTQCGHRLCRQCLAAYLGDEESKLCPVIEEDRQMISVSNVFPDSGIVREMKSLEVYCPFKALGCGETMPYGDMHTHTSTCIYRPTKCQYNVRGCQFLSTALTADLHGKWCGFQPVVCSRCGSDVNLDDEKSHNEASCPEVTITCPYTCGVRTKRREMENHSTVCGMRPIQCKYSIVGCTYKGVGTELLTHEANLEDHAEDLVKSIYEMKMSLQGVAKNIQPMTELRRQLDQMETFLIKTEQEIQERHRISEDTISTLECLVKEVEEEQRRFSEETQRFKEYLARMRDDVASTTRDVSRDLIRLEVRLAENELRFQMIETSSYDGVLIWKIKDFSKMKRNAMEGKTVSLYSQPFYSSRQGYKMCARVYPNGDGLGRNTHVSLYFVVMRGEYDSLLPWPFQLQVTLMLLDQSPMKRHLMDSFRPDPHSNSFKRPTRSEMNVASGCPLFAPHAVVDFEPEYLVQDTIFIRVSVDTSRLSPI